MTLDPEFFKLGTYNYIKIYVGRTSGEFYAYNIYVYIRCSNICTYIVIYIYIYSQLHMPQNLFWEKVDPDPIPSFFFSTNKHFQVR